MNSILKSDGLWILEHSYLPTMLERNSFDTICSEHLEYYSLQSMDYIFERSGFGSRRCRIERRQWGQLPALCPEKGRDQAEQTGPRNERCRKNAESQIPKPIRILHPASRKISGRSLNFFEEQKKAGKKVLGYGASTKGNTILAYFGIGPDFDSLFRRSKSRQRRRTITASR